MCATTSPPKRWWPRSARARALLRGRLAVPCARFCAPRHAQTSSPSRLAPPGTYLFAAAPPLPALSLPSSSIDVLITDPTFPSSRYLRLRWPSDEETSAGVRPPRRSQPPAATVGGRGLLSRESRPSSLTSPRWASAQSAAHLSRRLCRPLLGMYVFPGDWLAAFTCSPPHHSMHAVDPGTPENPLARGRTSRATPCICSTRGGPRLGPGHVCGQGKVHTSSLVHCST